MTDFRPTYAERLADFRILYRRVRGLKNATSLVFRHPDTGKLAEVPLGLSFESEVPAEAKPLGVNPRRDRVLELRREGKSIRRIAAIVGISPARVWQIVNAAGHATEKTLHSMV